MLAGGSFGAPKGGQNERYSTASARTRGEPATSAPVLLLYGEEYANLALADELALDGYEVRRASDPAMLRAACDTREIDLVIFGQAARRGAGLDVLRQLRAGAFAPQVKSAAARALDEPERRPGRRAAWIRGRRR